MPWKTVRKTTPCGWEEEEVWVDEPAKVPDKVPAKKNKKRKKGYDVTKEFERIKKKEPAVPA